MKFCWVGGRQHKITHDFNVRQTCNLSLVISDSSEISFMDCTGYISVPCT